MKLKFQFHEKQEKMEKYRFAIMSSTYTIQTMVGGGLITIHHFNNHNIILLIIFSLSLVNVCLEIWHRYTMIQTENKIPYINLVKLIEYVQDIENKQKTQMIIVKLQVLILSVIFILLCVFFIYLIQKSASIEIHWN